MIVDGETLLLGGRADALAGPTDFAYVLRGTTVAVTSAAVPASPSRKAKGQRSDYPYPPDRRRAGGETSSAAEVASRQPATSGTPSVLQADSIIACEVLTPAGNWSS